MQPVSTITLRHTTLGRTPVDRKSARRTGHLPGNTQQSPETNIKAPGGIRSSGRPAAENPSPTTRGHCCNHVGIIFNVVSGRKLCRVQLKCDGTRCRTGGGVKGKLANAVGSQYLSHYLGTWCIQYYYRRCAHLGCR